MVILEGVTSPEDAGQVADRVRQALREPRPLERRPRGDCHHEHRHGAERERTPRDHLLHDADVAMYRAKERGRGGQVALFDGDGMGGRSPAGSTSIPALHHALERGRGRGLLPTADLARRRADRRCRGPGPLGPPEHGILTPGHFIELAEDNGTIVPIGSAVLEQACRRAKSWLDTLGRAARRGGEPLGPSVPAPRPGGTGRRGARSRRASIPRSSVSRSPRAWPWTTSG